MPKARCFKCYTEVDTTPPQDGATLHGIFRGRLATVALCAGCVKTGVVDGSATLDTLEDAANLAENDFSYLAFAAFDLLNLWKKKEHLDEDL